MDDNRREFFRVFFDGFKDGKIKIDDEWKPIQITNMSAGGMAFITLMDFKMDEKLSFTFEILEKTFQLDGFVRRKVKKSPIEYGIEFKIKPGTSSELFQQLNYYVIRQREQDD